MFVRLPQICRSETCIFTRFLTPFVSTVGWILSEEAQQIRDSVLDQFSGRPTEFGLVMLRKVGIEAREL